MSPKINLTPKTKKILNIVVDVVVAVVLVFALFLAVCTISSRAKGYSQYTEVFGKAYLAVQSDSMKGDKSDNFSKGDLIAIKTVKSDDARDFKVGDVITFQTSEIVENRMVLNTHRIIEVIGKEGEASAYITHGDANSEGENERVMVTEVVGVYQGKAGGIGHMFLFMGSSAGFFTCIVLPTLLIVVYFAVNLILVIRKEKKAQTVEAEQAQLEEREKIRQELLAEMQSQKPQASDAADTENKKEDKTEDETAEKIQESPSDGEEDKK